MVKKTNKYITLIIIILLLAGISFILYPTVSNWFSARNHSKIIKSYDATTETMSSKEIESELLRAHEYNDILSSIEIKGPFVPEGDFAKLEGYTSILNIEGLIGYVEIPVIDVRLPIYHGTNKKVLQKGVGHMNTTAFPVGGTNTHSVLTAHRGLPSSELFTNLDKVKLDDLFYIHVLDQVLAYKVISTKVIEPTDTSDLQPFEDKDYITLITCTPYAINSHRLLVKAERVPYIEKDVGKISTKDNTLIKRLIVSPIIIIILLTVIYKK